jgi:hypothetical protein
MHQPDVATQADCLALTTLAIAYHEAARAVVAAGHRRLGASVQAGLRPSLSAMARPSLRASAMSSVSAAASPGLSA